MRQWAELKDQQAFLDDLKAILGINKVHWTFNFMIFCALIFISRLIRSGRIGTKWPGDKFGIMVAKLCFTSIPLSRRRCVHSILSIRGTAFAFPPPPELFFNPLRCRWPPKSKRSFFKMLGEPLGLNRFFPPQFCSWRNQEERSRLQLDGGLVLCIAGRSDQTRRREIATYLPYGWEDGARAFSRLSLGSFSIQNWRKQQKGLLERLAKPQTIRAKTGKQARHQGGICVKLSSRHKLTISELFVRCRIGMRSLAQISKSGPEVAACSHIIVLWKTSYALFIPSIRGTCPNLLPRHRTAIGQTPSCLIY